MNSQLNNKTQPPQTASNNRFENDSHSSLTSFSILDHLDKLTEDGGTAGKNEVSYHCPACGAENFKVDLSTGGYGSYSCDCVTTEEGKKKIRDTIAPLRKKKTKTPKQTRQWVYKDINGNSLIRTVRTDDGNGKKDIKQQYLIDGEWCWSVDGETKKDYQSHLTPLYFEEAIESAKKGNKIFIAEGEQCCDVLRLLGLTAITNIMGSGQWRDQYSQQLSDNGVTEVVVCPDRDKTGIKHADQVAESLAKYGIKIKWLYAYPESPLWSRLNDNGGLDIKDYIEDNPQMTQENIINIIEATRRQLEFTIKKDIGQEEDLSDADKIRKLIKEYLNASDTAEKIALKGQLWSRFKIGKDDLNQLVDEAQGIKKKSKRQVEVLSAKDLFNGENVGIKWLIPALLPIGGVTILGADSGKGKTTLAYDCAGAVTFNEDFLGEKPSKQGKVLILSSDEPKAFAIDKLANRGFSEDDNLIFIPNWTIDNWDILEKAMADHNPDLVIIDSFNSIHSNENFDANSDRAAITLNRLNEILEDHESACIMIHHLNKSKENKGVNKLRNSTAIAAASSMVWMLEGEGDVVNFSLVKTRGTEPLTLQIKMDAPSGKFNIVQGAVYDDESKSLSERIEALFKEKYPDQRLEFDEIKAEINSNNDGLRKALGRLVKLSILNKGKSSVNKKKSVWYLAKTQDDNKQSPSPSSHSSCPMEAETPNISTSQTLDTRWTDIGHVGQTLDKEIGQDDETLSTSTSQSLDKFIGQNSGQGERDCPSNMSNESDQGTNENVSEKETYTTPFEKEGSPEIWSSSVQKVKYPFNADPKKDQCWYSLEGVKGQWLKLKNKFTGDEIWESIYSCLVYTHRNTKIKKGDKVYSSELKWYGIVTEVLPDQKVKIELIWKHGKEEVVTSWQCVPCQWQESWLDAVIESLKNYDDDF